MWNKAPSTEPLSPRYGQGVSSHRHPSNPPGCEQNFATAERCQLAANSRAYATDHIGLFHEWVTQQLDTYVGHA
jgi:hypothetical protein